MLLLFWKQTLNPIFMNIKINKKSLIKTIIFFVVFLLCFWTFFYLYLNIRKLKIEVKNARMVIVVSEKKQKDFTLAQKNLTDYKSSIELVEKSFLSESGFANFLEILEKFALDTNVIFTEKGADFPSETGKAVKMTFRFQGKPSNIHKFLFLLDNSSYLGMIGKFVLTREKEGSQLFFADIDYLIFNYNL